MPRNKILLNVVLMTTALEVFPDISLAMDGFGKQQQLLSRNEYSNRVDTFLAALQKANVNTDFSNFGYIKRTLLDGKFSVFGKKLEVLPSEIGELKNINELYMDENNLTSLPREIGNLVNLKSISCARNQLTSVPKEIGQLNLTRLDLRGNPLSAHGENEDTWGQEELRAHFGNRVLLSDMNEISKEPTDRKKINWGKLEKSLNRLPQITHKHVMDQPQVTAQPANQKEQVVIKIIQERVLEGMIDDISGNRYFTEKTHIAEKLANQEKTPEEISSIVQSAFDDYYKILLEGGMPPQLVDKMFATISVHKNEIIEAIIFSGTEIEKKEADKTSVVTPKIAAATPKSDDRDIGEQKYDISTMKFNCPTVAELNKRVTVKELRPEIIEKEFINQYGVVFKSAALPDFKKDTKFKNLTNIMIIGKFISCEYDKYDSFDTPINGDQWTVTFDKGKFSGPELSKSENKNSFEFTFVPK